MTKLRRSDTGIWSLEVAKARFSEVLRKAQSDGPQHVTVRGRESAVIISAEDYERLTGAGPATSLVDFMEGLGLDGLNLEREVDRGRDVEL